MTVDHNILILKYYLEMSLTFKSSVSESWILKQSLTSIWEIHQQNYSTQTSITFSVAILLFLSQSPAWYDKCIFLKEAISIHEAQFQHSGRWDKKTSVGRFLLAARKLINLYRTLFWIIATLQNISYHFSCGSSRDILRINWPIHIEMYDNKKERICLYVLSHSSRVYSISFSWIVELSL